MFFIVFVFFIVWVIASVVCTIIGIKSTSYNLGVYFRETMAGDSTIRIEKFTEKNSFGLLQIALVGSY